jgi:hydroxypyruvate isomerase
MDRRQFIERAAAAAAVLPITSGAGEAGQAQARTFKLKYAPHIGMFEQSAGKDPLDQIRFMADNGFRAFEDNGMMARTPELQQAMGDLLAKRGMTMGVFVIDGGDNWKVSLATGKPEFKDVFLKACRASVDVAKRCGAKWMTVVPGYFARELPIGIQTGHVIDALRAGADILAPHNLTMVLEPLSDNPDLFLRTSDQAYAACRAVNSPACKILFDMYHMQRNMGRLVAHLDWAWDEIGYFQIGDVPDRNEPGTGEVHYQYLFKHIYQKAAAAGREFVLGMEHGNSRPGKDGEREVIDAYVRADAFTV